MVSIGQTSRKYRGRKAETYDAVREVQARWALENETVGRWLRAGGGGELLDCPVGTGRFLPLYLEVGRWNVIGVDVSDEMIELARKKMRRGDRVKLQVGDATKLEHVDGYFDVAVCVRFLDLIDENAMRAVMRELCRVTRRSVVLTIRLGERYVPKVNTAVHDRRRFRSLIGGLGWRVEESVPFRDQGWEIIRLGRK